MKYVVTTFDVRVQGFERLRAKAEFILVAHPHRDSTPESIEAEWLEDVQTTRTDTTPEDFEAARDAVRAFCKAERDWIQAEIDGVSWDEWDNGNEDDLIAFLYVAETADDQ